MAVKTTPTTVKKPSSRTGAGIKKKAPSVSTTKKPILIPKQFDQAQIKRSCKALLTHAHNTFLSTKGEEEEEEGEAIYLIINSFESVVDQKPELPTLIPVPNRVRPRLSKLQVCLIVNNPQKAVDDALRLDENSPTYETFADIISTSRLRSTLSKAKDVHQHKAAWEWVNEFDIIVYDGKLKSQSMRSLLGPRVYNKSASVKIHSPLPITLQPVPDRSATPVQIAEAQKVIADPLTVKKQLKYISNCVTAHPSPGTTLSVLVGLSSFTKEQLIENITAVLKVILNEKSPLITNAWENIRSMHIKTTESASLPLYTSSSEGLE